MQQAYLHAQLSIQVGGSHRREAAIFDGGNQGVLLESCTKFIEGKCANAAPEVSALLPSYEQWILLVIELGRILLHLILLQVRRQVVKAVVANLLLEVF